MMKQWFFFQNPRRHLTKKIFGENVIHFLYLIHFLTFKKNTEPYPVARRTYYFFTFFYRQICL